MGGGSTRDPKGAKFVIPHSLGADEAAGLSDLPTVGDCVRNWDTKARRTTPEIVAHGATLAAVKRSLDASRGKDWGEGGGELQVDKVRNVKRGERFTLTLRATFINRVPRWAERDKASDAARKEWDRFIGKLSAHEEGHVAIAVKAFETLANDLVGKRITEIATECERALAALKAAQEAMDTATDHGRKPGVKFGDALLNTSIT